jgi:hypothetical protein
MSGPRRSHRKRFEQLPIRGAHQDAIFGVPLDSHGESRIGFLERFDHPVIRNSRYDQPLAYGLDRLMMP